MLQSMTGNLGMTKWVLERTYLVHSLKPCAIMIRNSKLQNHLLNLIAIVQVLQTDMVTKMFKDCQYGNVTDNISPSFTNNKTH